MTCQYVYQRGLKKGQQCKVKPRYGGAYCGKHKKNKVIEPCQQGECNICLDEGDVVKVCKNGHIFHSTCIKEWGKTNNTCPICRIKMFDEYINTKKIKQKKTKTKNI